MPYRVQVVDGAIASPGSMPTWKPRLELPFESGSWERKRNSGGSGSLTLDTLDPRFKGVQRSPIWPWQSWVVIEWRHPGSDSWHVVYAGVITEVDYSWASKKITIQHSDVWSIWERRIVTNDRTNDIASSKVSWSGLSKATMIKRILQNAINPNGSPLYYDMPVLFPADVSGGESLTVYGYSFEKASDLIRDYIEEENGPDIDFRPRWSTDGRLEWVMEINPNTSRLWDYDLDAADASVVEMEYSLSGTGLANKVYGAGEGSERRTLVRQSDNNNSPYLALEASEKFSTVKDLGKLQAMTTGDRQGRDGAIRQLDMTVRADGSPRLSELALGGSIRWKADKDTWLLSGWHTWELIAFSGNLTDEHVSLTTQEMEGRAGG